MTLVKICGISTAEALEAAAASGADFVGFVFFPRSPRAIAPDAAAALARATPSRMQRVGLFVEPTLPDIQAVITHVPLDALQIYGAAGRLELIRSTFRLPVWRAVGIAAREDLPQSAGGADRLVIEAKPPPNATRPGGNAATFDWSLLRGWQAPVPWVLAGGLDPVTVCGAIRITGAPAVDVSSGVECAPGVKDPALIRAFTAAAKGALQRQQ
jgi:phosphoribosylanthranilate isomerase